MKIGIIGAGSIGLLLGVYLGRAHDVHMFVRREGQKEKLNSEGILCDVLENPTPVNAHLSSEMASGYDLWIVTIKQHGVEALLEQNLPTDAPYLFLQNGMGHLEKLSNANISSAVGVVEHGALAEGDNKVAHTGRGNIQIANFSHLAGEIVSLIEKLHTITFPFYYRKDHQMMLKNKLIINTVINPLTAVFGQKNRCILTNPYIQKIAFQLCEEACGVLDMDISKEWSRVEEIAGKTSENQSSMLKDLKEHRLTEIDSISGYILNQSPLPLPCHQFVISAIHALEYEEGVRSFE
ncbi:2-dehydropantoate 2-reductase [Halobacillus dabanensis]|uniref:2-dehydropantoate 2-reductase n=1 Tax=Halobacillus dabanensis TaxID=240302 RepID=A0A1I3VFW7_HALDA|nr:2-dehydropantoate 2-reductase [Halobacillus dabanensis]SFJ93051.1 2-dehydropantoate 2-reductase [Halobacillus dabanensis]